MASKQNNFQETARFTALGGINVSKFRSTKTGLSIVHVDVDGPLVEGAFALATEAHDNDGCPHTLEHLIFLGSEIYPYRGILDGVANRCLAQGTNAWTDTDHTAYTLSTAGSEGFLNMLPVYLDHILYPTLTDSGFHTEVHHITGDGEDAGVVYCEMQGRENTAISRVYRGMLTHVYANSAYASETGGVMANLRQLKADKVRDYHRQFYRPDNLCLVISGKVDEEQVFQKLQSVEEKIISKGPLPPMKRPWSTPIPALSNSIPNIVVPFPSDDEETGTFALAWRGPTYDDFETVTALKVLWSYLTESAVSPFHQALIEIEEPYCTEINPSMIEAVEYCHYALFSNVPTEKLPQIRKVIYDVFEKLVKEGIDAQRMQDTIHKRIRDYYNTLEEGPHRFVQGVVIGHFLYGKDDKELERQFQEVNMFESLLNKPNEYWVNLIKKSFIDSPFVEIQGTPSKAFGQQLQDAEKERIAKQKADLGEENLKRLSDELEKASEHNDRPIPDAIFMQFKIPDTSKIPFFSIQTMRNGEVISSSPSKGPSPFQSLLNNKENSLPFWIQFDHVSSFFLQIRVALDTLAIPEKLIPYVELYLEIIFKLPILRGNELISHEDVVKELERDTVSYSNSLGAYGSSNFSCGSFAHLAFLEMKFENSKYVKAIQWIHEILWNTQFTVDRLKIGVTKLLTDIPQQLRKGDQMVRATIRSVNFTHNCNHSVTNVIRQQAFLNALSQRLENPEEATKVCSEIEQFRDLLCHPNQLRIQVIGNISKLDNSKQPWSKFLPEKYKGTDFVKSVAPIRYTKEWLTQQGRDGGKGYILGMSAIDSSFLIQTAPTIPNYGNNDEASLLILIEYLIQLEGPFWKKIRGLGYSYGYSIRQSIDEGLISFYLFKSTNLSKAIQASKEIIDQILQSKEIDTVRFEGSVSGTVFEIVSREETLESAAFQSFLNYYKQVGPDGNKNLLAILPHVKESDLLGVLEKYLKPLFDFGSSNTAVTCNKAKVEELQQAFQEMNKTLTSIDAVETFFI